MNWRSWRVIDGRRRFQARERSQARQMMITPIATNSGTSTHGRSVNQGNHENGAQVCSRSSNCVAPSAGMIWITREPSYSTSTRRPVRSATRSRSSRCV